MATVQWEPTLGYGRLSGACARADGGGNRLLLSGAIRSPWRILDMLETKAAEAERRVPWNGGEGEAAAVSGAMRDLTTPGGS